jgi:phage terminase large subunit-like protein
MLIGDGEGGAEIYCVASKRDQARIVFSEAVNMVSQSPALRKHLKKRKTDLYFPVAFGKFEPLASESHSLDGLNSHCVVIDELHAIKDRNLYDVMRQSMAARTQPLLAMITTAGFVRECIYDDIYDYACRVLDGVVEDERFLAFLYELDDRSEWIDFKAWEKANPGLGTIKNYEDLAANVERAKNDPNFLPTVLTKDFNIRETTSGTWLAFEEANNEATFSLDELRDTYAIGGVDLSATTDLTAAAVLVMRSDGQMYAMVQGFMPGDTVEQRSKEDKVPYDRWVERGLITPCPGNRIDYRYLTDWFARLRDEYGISAYWVGYDSWNSPAWVEDMETRLGYTRKENLLPVIMGAKTLSAPMKVLRADLAAKRINYNNNPLLKWALTNMAVEVDKNENIRPVKGQNKRQRIDPAVALIIAYTVLQWKLEDYKALI